MAYALQQSTLNNGTTNATATFINTPTAGDLILASIYITIAAGGTPVVQDGNSNNFTQLNTFQKASYTLFLYAYIAGSSQSKSVKISTTGTQPTQAYINIYEFNGNFAATNGTASTFIDNAQTTQQNMAGTPTSSQTGAQTVTPSSGGDLTFLQLALHTGGTITLTGSGPWVASGGASITFGEYYPTTSGTTQIVDGYAIQTTTAAETPYATWTTGQTAIQLNTLLLPATPSLSSWAEPTNQPSNHYFRTKIEES